MRVHVCEQQEIGTIEYPEMCTKLINVNCVLIDGCMNKFFENYTFAGA